MRILPGRDDRAFEILRDLRHRVDVAQAVLMDEHVRVAEVEGVVVDGDQDTLGRQFLEIAREGRSATEHCGGGVVGHAL